MAIRLSKFEHVVVFGVFITLTGALVGGLYVLTGASESPAVVVAPEKPSEPISQATEMTVEQTLDLLTDRPKPVPSVVEPKRAADTLSLAAAPAASMPIAQPVMQMDDIAIVPVKKPLLVPVPVPPEQIAAVIESAPIEAPKPIAPPQPVAPPQTPVIKPYAIKLPANRVIHTYSTEKPAASWYELKLEPTQLETLRSSLRQIAQADQSEIDEFDHLADLPPMSASPIAWWRPAELTDLNVLSVGAEKRSRVWVAISQRTGRVFLYSFKPVNFGSI